MVSVRIATGRLREAVRFELIEEGAARLKFFGEEFRRR